MNHTVALIGWSVVGLIGWCGFTGRSVRNLVFRANKNGTTTFPVQFAVVKLGKLSYTGTGR